MYYKHQENTRFTRSKNFYCCRSPTPSGDGAVSRAQKISTVVDRKCVMVGSRVSRAQKISTVVDYPVHLFAA